MADLAVAEAAAGKQGRGELIAFLCLSENLRHFSYPIILVGIKNFEHKQVRLYMDINCVGFCSEGAVAGL